MLQPTSESAIFDSNSEPEQPEADEDEEHEHQTLLPFSNSLSINSNVSMSITRPRSLGAAQRSWSGGMLKIILLLTSVALVCSLLLFVVDPFHSANIINRADPTHDNDKTTAENNAAAKQRQIHNYIKGTAIIRNIHITHHAGTSVCGQMRKLGPVPGFACIGRGKGDDAIWPSQEEIEASHLDFSKGKFFGHWEYNETEAWVKFWRPYFHFISNEYRYFGNLHTTNWEYENLVSMIVMRHPIERFLAGGKCQYQTQIPGDPSEDNQDLYWEYANSQCADNYALKVLVNESNCVHGEDVSTSCLESAKELLSRFTFILDKACLDDSMEALGNALNLTVTSDGFENNVFHKQHPPLRERFGNDTLYEYVKRRFRHDIELYEWSKERSIVVCNSSSV